MNNQQRKEIIEVISGCSNQDPKYLEELSDEELERLEIDVS